MDSKSQASTTNSTESELNLCISSSSSSNTSDSDSYDDELPALRRSRKELDLRVHLTQCPSKASMEGRKSVEPTGEPITADQVTVLWRRRGPKSGIEDVHEDDRTVTCSVLKALDKTTVNNSQTLGGHSKYAGASAYQVSRSDMASDRSIELSCSSSHPIIRPVNSFQNLSDLSEESFVCLADFVRAPPSFDILRDVNGRVDMSDLLRPKDESLTDIAGNLLLKSTRGSTDITYPLEDPGKDEALPPARPTSCPNLVRGSLQCTSPMNKDQHVNFLLINSGFDIAYAASLKESEEESPIHPGIKSPKFSAKNTTPVPSPLPHVWDASEIKFIHHLLDNNCVPDEPNNNQAAPAPISPTLHQVYVVDTAAPNTNNHASDLPAADETEMAISPEENTDQHSVSEPSRTSSTSVTGITSTSMLETLPHSGSARLLENLPGLDGQWGQFGQSSALPTPQEQHEVEEEMLRLATRAKCSVPPMEVSLNEWDSIVKVLGMKEPVSVERVLCWLSKITTKRYWDLFRLYRCGLYDKVLSLLFNHPESQLIQNLTIKLIAEMCILPGCSLQILQNPQLVLHCITLLEDDNSTLHFQECSSKILSSVAQDRSIQRALLYEHDLIEVLLRRIINTPDPDVRCNCLELLIRVSNNERTCKRLIASKQFTLELFSTLIESKYAKIQQLALGMWELFTRYDTSVDFQTRVQSSGLPEFLTNILQTESMLDFSHLAVGIFCNMGNTTFGLNFLEQSGIVKFLVDYIDQPGKEGLLGCGLYIVVKLSVSKTGRALLVEFEVPFRLVKYLKYNEDSTLERACISIANVCQNLEALRTIVENEPAEDLIRLIYEDQNSSELKYSASRALFELSGRSETVCRQITGFNLTKVFHHLIWSGYSHVATLASISDTIQTISQYPDLKGSMIDNESVACLLDIIQGQCRESGVGECVPEDADDLRINAMQCLRCYMSDPLCRNIFADAYGVYVLLGNLKSPSILIRQATALFIDLAAQDPNLALQIVTAGIVPIMRDDIAMMIACPAWKKALQQIYDHHLPSKFAYCRRLEIKDITVEGFYIAATMKGNIEVLDNLLRDKKCPTETLYVCNFKTELPKPDGLAHVWQPQIKKSSYPGPLADLGQTSVARIWQRKAILLYGDLISPNSSRESSLELGQAVSPTASVASGRRASIQKRTNSLNRRLKGRKSKYQRRSLTSAPIIRNTSQSSETNSDSLNLSLEKYGVCPIDNELGIYLNDLRVEMKEKMGIDDKGEEDSVNSFLTDTGVVKAVEILAKFVVLRMSGSTDNLANLVNFFNVSVWELKGRDELNILPLGHLKAGLHLERSLLFKILADKIGLPCSLVRGEYGIAYNEICVPCPNNEFPVPLMEMQPNYLVDLMQNIGKTYFLGSLEACQYSNAPF